MSTTLRSLSWPAVIAATFLYYLLAVPWFAPFAFGPLWREAVGAGGDGAAAYVVPLVGAVAGTLAMAVLPQRVGAKLGLLAALCFSLCAVATDAVAPNQARPVAFFIVVGGYHLVGLTLVSVVLARFRRTR
ncbi:MAG: DUF1761 domain-containing protein [Myxococcaceae bacterium]|nr:DUF1761 domain-containing protein [Myxococcaceae bacterium]